MRTIGDRSEGHRPRVLIVLLWRAGLRISEALALEESDLDRSRGAVLVRRGTGGKRREVGMDRWAWGQLDPWLEIRRQRPIGALLSRGRAGDGPARPKAGRRAGALGSSPARRPEHRFQRPRTQTERVTIDQQQRRELVGPPASSDQHRGNRDPARATWIGVLDRHLVSDPPLFAYAGHSALRCWAIMQLSSGCIALLRVVP